VEVFLTLSQVRISKQLGDIASNASQALAKYLLVYLLNHKYQMFTKKSLNVTTEARRIDLHDTAFNSNY